jgi:hypothetical protein
VNCLLLKKIDPREYKQNVRAQRGCLGSPATRMRAAVWLVSAVWSWGGGLGLGSCLWTGPWTDSHAAAQAVSGSPVGARVLVDGVAAVLGGGSALEPARTILQSDVELRARLLLLNRGYERAFMPQLPRSLLAATLNELIGEHLIAIEAERVRIVLPGQTEVQRELLQIEREADGPIELMELLSWLGASQTELAAMAERRALIAAFLRANLEGVSVVTDAEVDARLQDDPQGYAAESPEAARAAARAAVAKEAFQRHIEHWVRVLRARTRVRVLAIYDAL